VFNGSGVLYLVSAASCDMDRVRVRKKLISDWLLTITAFLRKKSDICTFNNYVSHKKRKNGIRITVQVDSFIFIL